MKYLLILFTCISFAQFNPIFLNSHKGWKNPGNSDLVAYYKFDGNTTDSSALSPSGVASGTGITYPPGKISTALSFSTVGDFVTFADDNNYSFTTGLADTPFSVCFWVYYNAFATSSNRLVMKRDPLGTNIEWQILSNATTLQFIKGSGGAFTDNKSTIATKTFSTGVWYHIAVTSDGISEKIYVNGILSSGSTVVTGTYVAMSNTSSNLRMGDLFGDISTLHRGGLDEFVIAKNREYTQAEVRYLYNQGLGRTYPF